jgi:hypothetical protein
VGRLPLPRHRRHPHPPHLPPLPPRSPPAMLGVKQKMGPTIPS